MSRRRTHPAVLLVCLAAPALAGPSLTACAPAGPSNPCAELGDQCGRSTLGEMVYWVVERKLDNADECSEAFVTEFATYEEPFVRTFDEAITSNLVAQPGALEDLVDNAVQPLVRDGRLPALTDAVSDALALLVDDARDPDREALRAFMELAETRSVLEPEMVLGLVRDVLDRPDLPRSVHAMAAAAGADDGVAPVISSLATLIPEDSDDISQCATVLLPSLEATLLSSDGFEGTSAHPAWVARPDDNGNPRLAMDGRATLPAPYVDADLDGTPDVGTDEPARVDAAGAPIGIASIAPGVEDHAGQQFVVDPDGRPLAADGAPFFEYFDVRRTALGHLVSLAHAALLRRVHHDGLTVARAVLGDAERCFDGTDTCWRYPADDHALADLTYATLEAGQNPRAGDLMSALAILFDDDPALADRLLVSVGELRGSIGQTDTTPTDASLLSAVRDLIPVVDTLFVEPTQGGEPTARLLMNAILDASESDQDAEVEPLLRYTEVMQTPLCSANPLIVDVANEVDYTRPRWDGGRDNRSVIEKVMELFAMAESCEQSITITADDGTEITGTVAYVALYQLSGRGPGQVCGVANDLLDTIRALGASFGEDNLDVILESLLQCPDGRAMREGLESLESLAATGALDAVMPTVKVFRDQGELQTLITLVEHLVDDLHREDEGGASAIRGLLPTMADVAGTRAPEVMIDVTRMLDERPMPDGSGDTLADVMVDTLAWGVRRRSFIYARRETVANTSHVEEMLRHAGRVIDRVDAAGPEADAALDRLSLFMGERFALDTSGPEPRLRDQDLRPTVAQLMTVLAEIADLNDDDYGCHIAELQTELVDFLEGRDFATLVRAGSAALAVPEADDLDVFLASMIDPNSPSSTRVLQIMGAGLSTDVSDEQLDAILGYLGDVAADRGEDAHELIATLDALLGADGSPAVIAAARDLLAADAQTGRVRATVFTDAWGDVSRIEAPMCVAAPERDDVDYAAERVALVRDALDSRTEGSTIRLIYDLLE